MKNYAVVALQFGIFVDLNWHYNLILDRVA